MWNAKKYKGKRWDKLQLGAHLPSETASMK